MQDTRKITRFEVIDHRKSKAQIVGAESFGRIFVAMGIEVSLSFQDEGRTLKVFIKEKENKNG